MKKFIFLRANRVNSVSSPDLFSVIYGKSYEYTRKRIIREINKDLKYLYEGKDVTISVQSFGCEYHSSSIDYFFYGFIYPIRTKAKTQSIKYIVKEKYIEI